MEIRILGSGCAKCKKLEELAREVVNELGVQADVLHVTDMKAIMAYSVLSTPGLVINDQVKSSGRLPRREEIIAWLKEAGN